MSKVNITHFFVKFSERRKRVSKINKFYLLILVGLLVFLSGCSEKALKPKLKEYTNDAFSFETFVERKFSYTKETIYDGYHTINNIGFNIDEFYNARTKKYYYVLDLSLVPQNERDKNEFVSFEILKMSMGFKSRKGRELYGISLNTPVFINSKETIQSNHYFLFESKEKMKRKDFKLDFFLTNENNYKDQGETIETKSHVYHIEYDGKNDQIISSDDENYSTRSTINLR